MAENLSPVLAASAALMASAVAALLALWARERYYRWLYIPAPRRHPKSPREGAARTTT